ncbi:EamA family transporter [Schumannella luteola]|nr:EamA family transporter [Schumannella luteola]
MTSIGPPGVVAIRQLVAAAVLLPIARPRFWRFSRRTLGLVALLGLATAVMNLGLYGAIDRLGLALAVTLEFLGPLFVAVAGARRVRDFVAAALAAVGVLVLVGPGGTTDWLGVGFGLAGAAGWASYIYLNRSVGAAVPGFQGPALSASLGAVLTVPFLIVAAVEGRVTPLALLLAAVAGVCCSVVPMAADVFALRRIPPRVFGVMATLNPVAAAVAAVVILHQAPTVTEWVGIAVIATANVAATIDVRRRRARPSSEEAAA